MSGTRNGFANASLYVPLALALSACGGDGNPLVASSVPFEAPVDDADYIGKSFPVFFLVGEAGDPSGSVRAGKGVITYNSTNTVTIRLPGSTPIVFTRTGSSALGTNYEGTASNLSTVSAVVSNFASTTAFRLVTSTDDDYAVIGGFGFESPFDPTRASATYDTAGAVFLTAENVENFLPLAGDGNLSANFGAGTISGTLLSTDPVQVQLAGAAGTPDELAMQFMLESGSITRSGFNGDVTATAELVVDGAGAPVALDAAMANASAEGTFFGGDAEAIAGTFEGDLALSDDDGPLIDFEASGFVSGSKE